MRHRLWTCLLAAAAPAQEPWNIGPLEKDSVVTSNIEVRNRCRGVHSFILSAGAEMGWLEWAGSREVRLAPGQTGSSPVRIRTHGLAADAYSGVITVRCTDCGAEPGCRPETLQALLKVGWGQPELAGMRAGEIASNEVVAVTGLQGSALKRLDQRLQREFGLEQVRRVKLKSIPRVLIHLRGRGAPLDVGALVLRLQALPELTSAQPNLIYETQDAKADDPYSTLQYALRRIRAAEVLPQSAGKGVRIALLDTGVDYRHEDLTGQIAERRNFVKDDREFESDMHGTMVAGIIAARRNNGKGISGCAPDSKILAIKVCRPATRGSEKATGSTVALVEGLDYAISKRPQVINLSLGSRWNDATVAGLAREAVRRGIVVVAAAGNGGATGPPIYPAALEEVIAVTAVDARDELFDGATRGVYVDLAAPGVEVLTTRPGNDYRAATGTSFASPYVAGTLALLCARRPGSTPAQLQSLLEHTVEDLGAKGKDPLFGSGRLDACRAAGVCGSK